MLFYEGPSYEGPPGKEPEATDPMMLVGVELEADESSLRESCRVFAEEFARMGFSEARLLETFRSPFYAAPHRAYQALGEETVLAITREEAALWGRFRVRDRDAGPETGLISLPVLEGGQGERGTAGCPRGPGARRTEEE
jgi:hypothetical protein